MSIHLHLTVSTIDSMLAIDEHSALQVVLDDQAGAYALEDDYCVLGIGDIHLTLTHKRCGVCYDVVNIF